MLGTLSKATARARIAQTVVVAMVAGSFALLGASAASADSPLSVSAEVPESTLVGGATAITLSATDASPDARYNLSFGLVLPAGVSYRPGSTSPALYDDPVAHVDPRTGATTLFWQNVSDLAGGATGTLRLAVTADPAVFRVGSTFAVTPAAYASSDARIQPVFSGGTVSGYTDAATGDPAAVAITALTLDKSQPERDGKYLRGAATQGRPYTLTVTNNALFATTGATVVDDIPAGIEFLGAGRVDNTTGGQEYPGSGPTGAPAGDSPLAPASVDTVADPAGRPAGVYTRVVWSLGTLAPGQTVTITYATAVPLRENAVWPAGAAPAPASGRQAANLDNNTGPSTRQEGAGAELTNTAAASGGYTGPLATGASATVSSTASSTVAAQDVRVYKDVVDGAPDGEYIPGRLLTFALRVDVGQYVDASGITLTDTLPNGLCPVPDGAVVDPVLADARLTDCAGSGILPPSGGSYSGATLNPDGSFTLSFTPFDLAANGSATITYRAYERAHYTGGAAEGRPVVAGDRFHNTVALDAETTALAAVGGTPATVRVTDTSSATVTAAEPAARKSILPASTPGYAAGDGTYIAPDGDTPAAEITFAKGDIVWFELTAAFPRTFTHLPTIADYLPPGTHYLDGSARQVSGATPWRLDAGASTSGYLLWRPADGVDVPAGEVTTLRLAAVVDSAAPARSDLLTGNLLKLTAADSAGHPFETRDSTPFFVAAAPELTVAKTVTAVNGVPASGSPTVRAGDRVDYAITLTNASPALAVAAATVWDVLPHGVDASRVVSAGGGAVSDPGDAGRPAFSGNDSQSAIVWSDALAGPLAPGASVTLRVSVTLPDDLSPSTTLTNLAAVRDFTVTDNRGGPSVYHPAQNVDVTVPAAEQDAPAATATADVSTRDAGLTLVATTGLDQPGNDRPRQATIGEAVRYTATITVPAGTTVHSGRLTLPAPAGITFAGTPTVTVGGAAVGSVLSGADAQTVVASLGDAYRNAGDEDLAVVVSVPAFVADVAGNTDGVVRTATAAFDSVSSLDPDAALPTLRAEAATTVVLPQPALAVTTDAAGPVHGGQAVTVTLTPSVGDGHPGLKDAVVTDVIPAGLTLVPGSVAILPGSAGTVAEPVSHPDGTTTVSVRLTGPLLPGAAPRIVYQVSVEADAVAQRSYTDAASLVGVTVGAADAQPGAARSLTATGAATITVVTATILKGVDAARQTIGDAGVFTLTATVPANVALHGATIVEQLPTGAVFGSTSSVAVSTGGGAPVAVTPAAELTPSGAHAWVLGDLGSSPLPRVYTVVFTARVADVAANKAGTALTDTATVRWNLAAGPQPTGITGFDRTSAASRATVTVTEPAPTIAKAVDRTSPAPGDTLHYTLTVGNGTAATVSPAHRMTVTDALPAGIVVDPASIGAGGVYDPAARTITWSLPGPVTSAPTTLGYTATLAASGSLTAGATLTNTASITTYASRADGGRVYTAPIRSSVTVKPVFPAVVPAKSSVSGGAATLGQPFSWRVSATNTGTGPASSVTFTDTLPAGWSYQSGSARLGDGTPVEPDVAGSVLTWTVPRTLAAGATLSVGYAAVPGLGALAPGGLAVSQVNRVAVTATDATGAAGTASGPYGSGSATAGTGIPVADIVLAKTHDGDAVAGADLVWRLAVRNAGPDPSTGAFEVTDTLPDGVDLVSVAGTGWTLADQDGRILTFRHTDTTLASGASLPPLLVTVSLPAGTADGTVLTNTARVAAGSAYDPDQANNAATDSVTIRHATDLAVTKTGVGTAVAGSTFSWHLDVANLGPSDTVGRVTLTDTLPAGAEYVGSSAPGWTVDVSGRTVTFTTDATLAAHASAQRLTLTATLDSGMTGTLVNTASVAVGAPDRDTDPANDESTARTPITETAELHVAKTHLGEFVAGATGRYRFTVSNLGPSDAEQVRLTDALPDGLRFTGELDSTSSWSVRGTDPLVLELDGPLAAGASATVTVTVAIPADLSVGDGIRNTVVATSPTAPQPAENSDDTSASGQADLAIAKSHAGALVAGGRTTYTLTVANRGPSDAPGDTVVTDVLPAGLTLVSAAGEGWTHTEGAGGTQLFRHAGTIPAGTEAPPIQLTVAVAPDLGGATLTNTAAVAGLLDDPDLTDNAARDTATVTARAALGLTKTASSATVLAGDTVSYALTLTNDGPSDAANVVLTDPMPAGLTLVSVTPPADGGWAQRGDGVDFAAATLPVGSWTFEVTALAAADLAPGSTVLNTATATTGTVDPATGEPGSVTASVPVAVDAAADLSVTKTHRETEPVAGSDVTFDIQVTNDGPSSAAGPITVTDVLPAGFSFVGVAPGWTVVGTDPLTFQRADGAGLAPGRSATLTIVTAADPGLAPGPAVNTATASSATADPDPANDIATDTVDLGARAELGIQKTAPASATIGGALPFTIRVTNAGPSTARDVVVTDRLPAGLALDPSASPGWDVAADGATVTARLLAPLAPGEEAPPLVLVTTVDAAAYPEVGNTATASTSTPQAGPDPTATATVAIPPLVDLAIRKSHDGDFLVGQDNAYTITVTNDGPTAAPSGFVVTDDLPDGLAYTGFSGDGWTAVAGAASPSFRHDGALAVGQTATLVLTARAVPGSAPSAANVATVHAVDTDPNAANDLATDPTTIVPVADVAIQESVEGTPRVGGTVTLLNRVVNNGPSAADAVVVTDLLPAGLTFVSAEGDDWEIGAEEQGDRTLVVARYRGGPLAAGDTAPELRFVVRVETAAFPSVANTAVVSTATRDSDPDNDTSTVRIATERTVDLGVQKTHDGDLIPGTTVDYRLLVVNHGPLAGSTPVVLTDTLPAGLSYVSTRTPGWSTTVRGNTVTLTSAGPLDVGEASEVVLRAAVGGRVAGTVANTVAVTSGDPDPDQSNDTAVDVADPQPIVGSPHLTLAKRAVDVGPSDVTWEIVVANTGTAPTAGGLVVSDLLPAGLGYRSAAADASWSIERAGDGLVARRAAALPAGASTTITVVTAFAPSALSVSVVNTATVRAADGTTATASATAVLPGGDALNGPARLADTGLRVTTPGMGAAALLFGGGLLLWSRRRRRRGGGGQDRGDEPTGWSDSRAGSSS